jgi:thiol-disulfide isomerase/thioredoxin
MSARSPRPTNRRNAPAAPDDRRRVLLIAGAIGLLVVVVGLVVALAGGADDDKTSTTGTADGTAQTGPVIAEDSPLATFAKTADDAAVGAVAPLLEGIAPDGSPTSVGGTGDGTPTLVTFVAHWCPHCQRELPLLVDLVTAGDLDGIRTVAVLTGTSAQRPNYPPTAWLEREGWTGDVLLDDEQSTAAAAYGLSSYPFLVFLDGDGKVVARASGELPKDDILALAALAR